MKAWVVTVTSLAAAKKPNAISMKVIALLSARKGSDCIKTYIENIYHLIGLDLEGQQAASQYNKPVVPIKVMTASSSDVYCFKHPFLIRAQRSKILNIKNENGKSFLQWEGEKYKIFSEDPKTHEIVVVREETPSVMQAPQADIQLWDLFD